MILLLLIILLILSTKFLRTFFKYLINSIFNTINISPEEHEKMTTKAKIIEGRSRILNCLALCGAEEEPVILLELQKAYHANYETYLNKDEVRTFFGKGHIKQVFQQFMKDDVTMSTNPNETGSLYLQMKRPLAESLIASVPMIAKNSVPVMAEPKKSPVLVPVSALTKMSAIRKEIGKRSSSSSFISAYNNGTNKGVGKMAATGANAIPIAMKKVDVGKNNRNYLDEEKDGQQEYAASDATFVSKSEKSVVKSSSNVKVKSNQPADADGLYSDDDDEVEAEMQQNNEEEGEELMEEEGEDEVEEVDDWENDDDYGWDEKKEDEKMDEMAANGGCWLKTAKMDGGQTAVAGKKTVTSKMPTSLTTMQNEQPKNGIKQQYKTTLVVNKPTLPKPMPAVVEKKKPVASANKFVVPSDNIFATSEDESMLELEPSTDEMDEAQEANDKNSPTEIVPEVPKTVVKNGNVMTALAANSVDGNTTPRIPTPASLASTATMTAPAPIPDSFKYQMLAIITTLVHIHRVYKVTDLHEMLSNVDGYKVEYAAYLPTSEALVQFVQRHCDAINLHKFVVAKDQAFFVLDANRIEQLNYLHCKIGKSLEAAAINN